MAQVVYLVGVVDDGSPLKAPVPANTARTIQVPLQSDLRLEVGLVYNSGVQVDLVTGAPTFNAWFTIVRSPDSCRQAVGKFDYQLASMTLKDSTRNVLVFAVPSTALRRFPAGRYFYDVVLQLSGKRYEVVRVSGLHLEMSFRQT